MILRISNLAVVSLVSVLLISLVGALPALAGSDAEIEECLATGKIAEVDEILIGLTKPLEGRESTVMARGRRLYSSTSM